MTAKLEGSSRWLLLFLSTGAMLCSYLAFDQPSALKNALQGELKLSDFQFNALYTVDALPNIVWPLFAGMLVDYIGASASFTLFVMAICCGQLALAVGVSSSNFVLMLVGRGLFGMGAEAVSVAQVNFIDNNHNDCIPLTSSVVLFQNARLSSWFEGKEKSFSLGINLSMARLGTVLNYYVSPILLTRYSLTTAFWFGLLVVLVSLGTAWLLVVLERVFKPVEGTASRCNVGLRLKRSVLFPRSWIALAT
jgi:nitrate/nitrite transporter NarK